MKSNVGGWDRNIRIVLGIVLIALGVLGVIPGMWVLVAYIIGVIALLTGVIRFCPLNALLGINSCRSETPRAPG
jgi:hypothetical protein